MYYGRYFRLDTDASTQDSGTLVFRYCPNGTDGKIRVTFSETEIEFLALADDINNLIFRIPLEASADRRRFRKLIADAYSADVGQNLDFSSEKHSKDEHSYYTTFRGKDTLNTIGQKKASSRKLLLDFLFDLQETRVFDMSPRIVKIKRRLDDNFFAYSIGRKAAYLYQRKCYEEILAQTGDGTPADKEKRQFYAKLMFAAERDWTYCICDPRADEFFHESNGWFAESEEEMKRVYVPWLDLGFDVENSAEDLEKKKRNDKRASQWLVGRYQMWFALKMAAKHRSFWGIHLFIPRLFAAITFGWFTVEIADKTDLKSALQNVHPFVPSILLFVVMLLFTPMLIRRIAPLISIPSLWVRSFHLLFISMIFSGIIGGVILLVKGFPPPVTDSECFFSMAIQYEKIAIGAKITSELSPIPYHLFWSILAVYIGLVVQFFLVNQNPSDPV